MTTRRASAATAHVAGTDSRREENGGRGAGGVGPASAPPASGADPNQQIGPDSDLAPEREDHAVQRLILVGHLVDTMHTRPQGHISNAPKRGSWWLSTGWT